MVGLPALIRSRLAIRRVLTDDPTMRVFTTLTLLLLAAGAIATGQVSITEEPRHRIVYQNDRLRIYDVNVPPGEMSLEHRHDYDIATISMTDSAETRTQSPGQAWTSIRPRRPLGDVALTEYTGKPGTHRVENVGKTPYHLFAVENLKTSGWSIAAAAQGLATTMVAEGRAFRVYDVRLASDRSQTSHTHAGATVIVLIAGNALSDGSDAQAKALAPAPVGLKQLDRPGRWVLVPGGDTHHVVRMGSAAAHLVEIELR